MPTTKSRINLSVPSDLEKLLKKLAKRDNMPVATKAIELIKEALELEEDRVLSAIGEARDRPDAKYVSEEEVWKKYLS